MSWLVDVADDLAPVFMVIMMLSVMLLIVWEEPAYYLLCDVRAALHTASLSADNIACRFCN